MSSEQLLLLLIAALAAVAALMWWRASKRAGWASRARNQRAQSGEQAAEELLESLGYEVLERQLSGEWKLEVDGETVRAGVRADLLVQRDGLVFVAEVKTGTLAPHLSYAPTRRQLLEYWFVFGPDGLLLVDMESMVVREVRFDLAT
ncbi:MAG: hypothetical protein ACI9VR_004582 [Cognaticolwellia sp.]|jgi:membrane protein implicated in regulation of membrane protease activity